MGDRSRSVVHGNMRVTSNTSADIGMPRQFVPHLLALCRWQPAQVVELAPAVLLRRVSVPHAADDVVELIRRQPTLFEVSDGFPFGRPG